MRRLLPLLLLLGLVRPGSALAQAIDFSKGGPIEVTSRDGMEWRQNEQEVIASGAARAVRGDVTVTADRLTARYRRKAAPTAAASVAAATPAPAPAPGAPGPAADTGNNEIYRLEAEGNVHIFTPTDQAWGDRAVYDIDKAVLVMTGHDMKITTPQQLLTARDAIEYWTQQHMAVGRGAATVTTTDGRRLAGDTIVGYTSEGTASPPATAKPTPVVVKAPADPLAASGKLQKVEAYGNVEVRTATEIVHGDRGVYVPDTQIARLVGHVRITRGQNQLNGDEALVNMRTGVSDLLRKPGDRVQGLVIPNDPSLKQAAPASPAPPGRK